MRRFAEDVGSNLKGLKYIVRVEQFDLQYDEEVARYEFILNNVPEQFNIITKKMTKGQKSDTFIIFLEYKEFLNSDKSTTINPADYPRITFTGSNVSTPSIEDELFGT